MKRIAVLGGLAGVGLAGAGLAQTSPGGFLMGPSKTEATPKAPRAYPGEVAREARATSPGAGTAAGAAPARPRRALAGDTQSFTVPDPATAAVSVLEIARERGIEVVRVAATADESNAAATVRCEVVASKMRLSDATPFYLVTSGSLRIDREGGHRKVTFPVRAPRFSSRPLESGVATLAAVLDVPGVRRRRVHYSDGEAGPQFEVAADIRQAALAEVVDRIVKTAGAGAFSAATIRKTRSTDGADRLRYRLTLRGVPRTLPAGAGRDTPAIPSWAAARAALADGLRPRLLEETGGGSVLVR